MADSHSEFSTPVTEVESRPRTRKRRWPRFVFFTIVWLLAIVVVLCGGFVLWLRSAAKSALPVIDGDIHLASQGSTPALSAPATVRRDQHGVPHIDAATQEDMFVAQGYVTAQDRLWQMDAYRRSAEW